MLWSSAVESSRQLSPLATTFGESLEPPLIADA
jgi:hypothetical protein